MKASVVLVLCILGIISINTVAEEDCPVICPLLYNPVCAQDSDGQVKTYSNRCEYNSDNCRNPTKGLRILKVGVCSEDL